MSKIKNPVDLTDTEMIYEESEGLSDESGSVKSDPYHNIKIEANIFKRKCKEAGVPCFLAFYHPKKGYQYAAMFPEEFPDDPELTKEYGKFKEFLRVCIDFNKEDYMPTVSK